MTDRQRRAAKYLPFDSLKGLKEAIVLEDQKSKNFLRPNLTEEEKNEMNMTLLECFSNNQAITIVYYTNDDFKTYSGVIQKIDLINKQIILLPKKKFSMKDVYKIIVK